MPAFNVHVVRVGYSHYYTRVTAANEEQASERAIDEAADQALSEKSSEYEIESLSLDGDADEG